MEYNWVSCTTETGEYIWLNSALKKPYLLHCWQNLCSLPLIITTGVFEWRSQTLWRRWYSLHLLRSDEHPSTKHSTFFKQLRSCVFIISEGNNNDVNPSRPFIMSMDPSCKSPNLPSPKSFSKPPPFFPPTKLLDPLNAIKWELSSSHNPATSQADALTIQSMLVLRSKIFDFHYPLYSKKDQ